MPTSSKKPPAKSIPEMTRATIAVLHGRAEIPPPASEELQKIARGLLEEKPRLVQLLTEMLQQLPDYARIEDPEFWTEVSQSLPMNVEAFFRALVTGPISLEAEVSATRFYARRRAEQGIRLEDHLSAYRNGMWILWEALVAGAGAKPKLRDELLSRAVWLFRQVERISAFITQTYVEEQEGRARERDGVLRQVFDELLEGRVGPDSGIVDRAAAVHVDLQRPVHVLVAVREDTGRPSAGSRPVPILPAIAASIGVAVDEVAGIDRGRETLALLPTSGTQSMGAEVVPAALDRLEQALVESGRLVAGVSGPVVGVDGVQRGYEEARRAIEVGSARGDERRVNYYPTIVIDDVLRVGTMASRRLVRDALGPLLTESERNRGYIETLEAYFVAGFSLKVAAANLDIHPNTLAYRMRRIVELSGLDVSKPEHRIHAEVAIRLLRNQKRSRRRPASS